MHGRYESHILIISITCVYYIHTMILLYFSTIYFILDIPYMNINRSTTPAGQLWFVCLILLYVTYHKYFYLTSTMTHFYAYYLRINCKIEFDWWHSSQGRLKNPAKSNFDMTFFWVFMKALEQFCCR